MRKIRALAPAKVNLTFDILSTMPDGYHQVETLLQAVDLQDDLILSLEESESFSIKISCSNDIVPHNFPTNESNLMAKAAKLYLTEALGNDRYAITIEIEKNIPIGAGLAGGSTN